MVKILPTIFKRTETGKIQSWTAEIDGDKFRVVTGQVGGKKVTSTWKTCLPKNPGKKNATTGEEQAIKEANAKRNLKLEAEYRASVDDIDDVTIWKSPMLAEEFKDGKTGVEVPLTYPVWTQPKLDGMRCIVTKEGAFSREGNPIAVMDHVVEACKVIFDALPDIVALEIDGELYNHIYKDDFDTLISIARKGKATPERLADAKAKIQYHIYDLRLPDYTFEGRNDLLRELFKLDGVIGPYHDILKRVPTRLAETRAMLDLIYDGFIDEGYEGQMIRASGSKYEFKRTKNLLKRKEWITVDLKPKDIQEGEGNRSGMAGRAVFEIDGKEFAANIRGGNERYKELLENKEKYIDKIDFTLRYQNLTPDGIPRFPVVIAIRDYE